MHIISRKALTKFAEGNPDAAAPLDRWYRIARRAEWANFAEPRADFPSADQVDRHVVFNIGGNKYRLAVVVHHIGQVLYNRAVTTHAGYDRGDWKG